MPFALTSITYEELNARQKENYNFQKISAKLADYGFTTIRLSDDWKGADFLAKHIDGDLFLKVQLKTVLTVNCKYLAKDIWICFRHGRSENWYLYPHDDFLQWALANTNIRNTKGWRFDPAGAPTSGIHTWPSPNRKMMAWLNSFLVP